MSKNFKQYAEADALTAGDTFLLQRGNNYYSVDATALTTGARATNTYTEVQALIGAGTLLTGAIYYLSDKYTWVTAIDSDKIALDATYFARNADYNAAGSYTSITIANGFTVNATGTNLGVWTSALAPASGDVAIWNNLHYVNITGANGGSNPPADATNWEAVPNTDVSIANNYGYIYEYDAIEYDFNNDSINRRVDIRGKDIGGGISAFQWGNDKVALNVVEPGGSFNIINVIFSTANKDNVIASSASWTIADGLEFNIIQGNYVASTLVTTTNNATLTISYNNFFYRRNLNLDCLDVGTLKISNKTFNQSQSNSTLNFYMYAGATGSSANGDANNFNTDIELVAAAYNAGTTYNFGDFQTTGTVTYMYINATPAAGNAAPNATYWVEVYDFTTAGRYKLSISKYFEAYGVFNISSTNATETIDEIVFSNNYFNPFKLTCSTALTLTLAFTGYASLANEGEFLQSSNVAIEGAKYEAAVYERFNASGVLCNRVVINQTLYI